MLVINFFRDPHRTTPNEKYIVVSPADGKVVLIQDVAEPEYVRQDAVQVSIFMSPLDVHVNRWPISGTVEYFKHVEGTFTAAYHDKASESNERTLIGVQENGYRLLFKQIAGAVARRIVADVSVGQHIVRGERFGMIRFGSRVDVIMPKHTAVNVKLHDRVVAGETVLAIYSPAVQRV
jgi:phosphatidylserine decarboxylase